MFRKEIANETGHHFYIDAGSSLDLMDENDEPQSEWKLRFAPISLGEWTWVTDSDHQDLDGLSVNNQSEKEP